MNKQPPHVEGSARYGFGVVLQAIGIVVAVIMRDEIGIIAGLALVVIGAIIARNFSCSECGNKVSSKRVKLCPTCHAHFWNV